MIRVLVRPRVPYVSRVCPGSPRCLFTGRNTVPLLHCPLVNRETRNTGGEANSVHVLWAFLLTVKRDTRRERTNRLRNSWGAVRES